MFHVEQKRSYIPRSALINSSTLFAMLCMSDCVGGSLTIRFSSGTALLTLLVSEIAEANVAFVTSWRTLVPLQPLAIIAARNVPKFSSTLEPLNIALAVAGSPGLSVVTVSTTKLVTGNEITPSAPFGNAGAEMQVGADDEQVHRRQIAEVEAC